LKDNAVIVWELFLKRKQLLLDFDLHYIPLSLLEDYPQIIFW